MLSVLMIAVLVAGAIAGVVAPAQAESGSCVWVSNPSQKTYVIKSPRETDTVWIVGPKYAARYLKKQNGDYLKVGPSTIIEVSLYGGQAVKVPLANLSLVVTDVALVTAHSIGLAPELPSECSDADTFVVVRFAD